MADYCRVCAIDVGYKNFAYCIVDNVSYPAPVTLTRQCLWRSKARPSVSDAVQMIVAWCKTHDNMLAECDHIVLENQLRPVFIAMNAALEALHPTKVTVVNPRTVGAFWRLPTKREPKKLAAIQRLISNGIGVPAGKADDMADAWLMAAYQMVQAGAWHEDDLKI